MKNTFKVWTDTNVLKFRYHLAIIIHIPNNHMPCPICPKGVGKHAIDLDINQIMESSVLESNIKASSTRKETNTLFSIRNWRTFLYGDKIRKFSSQSVLVVCIYQIVIIVFCLFK